MSDGRAMSSRPGPVPIEFIGADAEGHVVDTRDGGRLVARGAVSWPLGGEPQGQGWYHPAALIPPCCVSGCTALAARWRWLPAGVVHVQQPAMWVPVCNEHKEVPGDE